MNSRPHVITDASRPSGLRFSDAGREPSSRRPHRGDEEAENREGVVQTRNNEEGKSGQLDQVDWRII